MEVGGQRHTPGRCTPGKDPVRCSVFRLYLCFTATLIITYYDS